jgi:hypothetical protein
MSMPLSARMLIAASLLTPGILHSHAISRRNRPACSIPPINASSCRSISTIAASSSTGLSQAKEKPTSLAEDAIIAPSPQSRQFHSGRVGRRRPVGNSR